MMGFYSLDLDQDSDQDLNNSLERRPLRSSASATNQRVGPYVRRRAVYSYSAQDLRIASPDRDRPRRPMLESFAGCLKEL